MKLFNYFSTGLLAIFASTSFATTQYIHWGTSTDLLNGLTVTWNGNGTADSIAWGYTPSYEKGYFKATERTQATLTGTWTGNWFFYNLGNGITGGSTIYYKIKDSKAGTWGSANTYNTVPAIPADPANLSYSFSASGDSRDGASTWTTIANGMDGKKPNFVLFNGDITATGDVATEWQTWFTSATNLAHDNIMLHCEGNHDAAFPAVYLNMFDLPHNGDGTDYYYYATTYGNTLFLTLNYENTTSAFMTAQTTWLKNQLIAARAAGSPILWIVASWHEPYYTCGEHSGDMDPSFTYFWPLFDQYGVDLILNGHDHSYQRFKPINRTVSTTAPVSAYGAQTGQGRCEIICGGAGAPLYTQESTVATPFLQTFQSINNFVTCDVTGCSGAKETKIHITAYNSTGTMIDSLTLSKACPLTTGIEPNSRPVFNPIKVIPNPVSDKMTLRYSSALQGEAIIEIHDTQGKKIRTEKVGKFQQDLEYTIDVTGIAKGAYLMSVIMGSQKDDVWFIVK